MKCPKCGRSSLKRSEKGVMCGFCGHQLSPGEEATYHHDASRTGFDPSGGPLTSILPGWVSPALDGEVYAEPLLAAGMLVAATENNTVFALNDSSGRIIWQRHLGAPVPRSDLPCGNIDPTGITGTPVIDSTAQTVYVVRFLRTDHKHWLFAIDLTTGAVTLG